MKNTRLKTMLKNRDLTIGSWITIGHPAIPDILAQAGFDWLVIDIEHTTIDLSMVQDLISIIQSHNIAALVRVSKSEEVVIKRVLDAGADGIIVPMICSADDAYKAIEYAKYPPVGKRGVGLARAQGYGTSFDDYLDWLKNHLVVIAQIEHIEGIKQLDSILMVEGLDGTIVGPYDLSGSLGIPGQYNEPSVIEALRVYEQASKKYSKSMGYHVIEPDCKKLKEKIHQGYNFIAFSTDFFFMSYKANEEMNNYFDLAADT